MKHVATIAWSVAIVFGLAVLLLFAFGWVLGSALWLLAIAVFALGEWTGRKAAKDLEADRREAERRARGRG